MFSGLGRYTARELLLGLSTLDKEEQYCCVLSQVYTKTALDWLNDS